MQVRRCTLMGVADKFVKFGPEDRILMVHGFYHLAKIYE